MSDNDSSSSKLKSKGKGKNAKKKKNITEKQKPSSKKNGKPKGKCFKCGEKGHWERECPKIVKLGTDNLFVIEVCLVQNSTNTWIIDSGATNHIYNSLF